MLCSQTACRKHHTLQSKSAPSGGSARASMHGQPKIPPINSAPHYAAAAGSRLELAAEAGADHSKGQPTAPVVQDQPGTEHPCAKALQFLTGSAYESLKAAAPPMTNADSHDHPEGRHCT